MRALPEEGPTLRLWRGESVPLFLRTRVSVVGVTVRAGFLKGWTSADRYLEP